MMLPTIHLNGTSAEELYKQVDTAYDAIQLAYKRLREAAPNGRDYYPQGPREIYQAENEHFDRLKRLESIQDELEKIMEHLTAQMELRKR